MEAKNLIFRVHAIQRMFERRISEDEIRSVLETGKTIMEYPDDKPYPSRLMLGFVSSRPLHIVVADDAEHRSNIIITAYEPDPNQWEQGFERKLQ